MKLAFMLFFASIASAQTIAIGITPSPSAGVTMDNIYRCSGACVPTTVLAVISGSATSYMDTAVSPGSTYSYFATAVAPGDTIPESIPSNTVTKTVPAAPPPTSGIISINFVGNGATMAATESAGVVPETNWNQATGSKPSTPIALRDSTGATTPSSLTWTCTPWALPITDVAGNVRMMRGYCDDSSGQAITATVTGTPGGTYNIYVYADGDNGTATRAASYALTGPGFTTGAQVITDAAKNFSGTFTLNSNYVEFNNIQIASGFTVTATPTTASDGTKRAPINGIQIIPVSVTPPPPPPPPPPTPTLILNCSSAITALTQTNIPAGTMFSITASSDGLTSSCTGSF